MRKTREEKAITLIALIITIVVLLILAVVAINAVTGDGIIQHATNAKTEYEKAQDEENSILSYYETYLDNKGDVGPWKQEGNIIYMTDSDGEKIELKIGDKVNYIQGTGYKTTPNPNKGIGESGEYNDAFENKFEIVTREYTTNSDIDWRILGISSSGKIELISTMPVESLYMAGKAAFLNIESNLNTFCNDLYGKGKGANSARSLAVDDINKLAGYDPTSYEGYGAITTYTSGTFITEDLREVEATEEKPVNFKSTYYTYTLSDEIDIQTRDNKNMYNIITKGEDGTNYINQFLASRRFSIGNDVNGNETPKFNILAITEGGLKAALLFGAFGAQGSITCAIRPVVTLNSNVTLTDVDNNGILEIN